VKVSVVRGGGLAGIVQTTTADSETLPPDDAEALRLKVDEAGFFDVPAEAGRPSTGPDRFAYAVTVEDAERAHTVRRSEADLPEGVRALVAWVFSVPGRREAVTPPGEFGGS
jgi:hypothetical protein